MDFRKVLPKSAPSTNVTPLGLMIRLRLMPVAVYFRAKDPLQHTCDIPALSPVGAFPYNGHMAQIQVETYESVILEALGQTWYFTPGGNCFDNRSSSATTARSTSSALAVGSWMTPNPTASTP